MKPFSDLSTGTLKLGTQNLGVAGVLFATVLFAVSLVNPTTWLQNGFDAAIQRTSHSSPMISARLANLSPSAGSEEFWLGVNASPKSSHVHPATWQTPIVKGQRFTISSGDDAREFEVVEVEMLWTSNPNSASSAQRLVTCRTTDGNRPETIKFVLDANAQLPWTTKSRQLARTL